MGVARRYASLVREPGRRAPLGGDRGRVPPHGRRCCCGSPAATGCSTARPSCSARSRCATRTSTRCRSSRSGCSPGCGRWPPTTRSAAASCASSSCRSTASRPGSRTPADAWTTRDHVGLLRARRRRRPGGTWADIGAGHGAFTLALADLLGPGRDDRRRRPRRGRAPARTPTPWPRGSRRRLDDARRRPDAARSSCRRSTGWSPPTACTSSRATGRSAAIRSLADAPPARRAVRRRRVRRRPRQPVGAAPVLGRAWERLAARPASTGRREIGRVPSRFLGAIYARGQSPAERGDQPLDVARLVVALRRHADEDRVGGSVGRGRAPRTGQRTIGTSIRSSSKSSSCSRTRLRVACAARGAAPPPSTRAWRRGRATDRRARPRAGRVPRAPARGWRP